MDFVRSVLTTHTMPRGPIVEIGGRNINGSVRPLFDGLGPYASIDLYEGRGVDLVGDVCQLDPKHTARLLFQRTSVTCVVCCEVLEHAPNGTGVCRWAHRILARGGVFIVTAANPDRFTHSGIDGGSLQPGEYYAGVSKADLTKWLRMFSSKHVQLSGADIYAVAWKGR